MEAAFVLTQKTIKKVVCCAAGGKESIEELCRSSLFCFKKIISLYALSLSRKRIADKKVRLLLTRVANCLLSMRVYRCDMQVCSRARFSPIYSSILYEDSESDATGGFFLTASSKDHKLDFVEKVIRHWIIIDIFLQSENFSPCFFNHQ